MIAQPKTTWLHGASPKGGEETKQLGPGSGRGTAWHAGQRFFTSRFKSYTPAGALASTVTIRGVFSGSLYRPCTIPSCRASSLEGSTVTRYLPDGAPFSG